MNISSMNIEELTLVLSSLDIEKYRALQIFDWIHKKYAKNFEDMTNIPKKLRVLLSETYTIEQVEIEKKYESFADKTTKYLLSLEESTIIESVLMRYSFGNCVCVSSQAGCAMACAFCHSGQKGLIRNLTPFEMLAQIYRIGCDIKSRISNIVIMGSGEPLHNFHNVLKFIEIINSAHGSNIGKRHITLSTCGLVPQMYDLARENPGINIAVSLHAPNDEIRKILMPVAENFSIDSIIKACDYYFSVSGRRITYEYAMICGINDGKSCARQLGERLKGKPCLVNIIPVNEIKEKGFLRPSKNKIKEFYDILSKGYGVETTIRRELGSSVNAACGQLS